MIKSEEHAGHPVEVALGGSILRHKSQDSGLCCLCEEQPVGMRREKNYHLINHAGFSVSAQPLTFYVKRGF